MGVKKFPSCLLKSNSVWPSHDFPGRWNVQGRGSQFLATGKGGNSREQVHQQYELRVSLVSIHHGCCCWLTHGVRKLPKKDRYPLQFSVVFDELGILLFWEASKALFYPTTWVDSDIICCLFCGWEQAYRAPLYLQSTEPNLGTLSPLGTLFLFALSTFRETHSSSTGL